MDTLRAELERRARAEGFSALRVSDAALEPAVAARLSDFIAEGFHGDMGWLAESEERRGDPRRMWAGAHTAVLFALSYGPGEALADRLARRGEGVISVYALGRDYHDLIKGKLKRIGQWFARASASEVKVFVDTAPLMEKPLAHRAGLGWQGKHTNLVSRQLGSWFFLGAMLTSAELTPDAGEQDHCGTCRACLDACPTAAFPAPYRIDARRCISYLTIEHRGHIAREFRVPMGNRIFGCDDCLAACPWNKFAEAAREAGLAARAELARPALAQLLRLDDRAFRAMFAGSPVKRTGRDRFLRNVLIAAGNSGDRALIADISPLLADASALVRAMAIWALSRLAGGAEFARARQRHLAGESDPFVRAEWEPP